MPDHDMVVQRDLQSARRFLQSARHLDVVPGRLGVAGRMVMHDDQRGGVEDERPLHHLARIYRRMIDCPALLHLVGNKGVLTIKKQHTKLLNLLVSHRRLQVVYERPPVAQHGTSAHFRAGHAAGADEFLTAFDATLAELNG